MSNTEVWVVSAKRTPVGRLLGGLSSVRPDDLAGAVMADTVKQIALAPEVIDEVYFGCANQAGEDNRNIARMALLLAGFPHSVPGVTVNRLCASGLEAINQAARAIALGDAEVALAGGVESMSRAPWVMGKPVGGARPVGNQTMYDSSLGWRFPNPAMEALFPLESMGETAENLAEEFAISRAAQDAFALASHQRAAAAWAEGRFATELCPIAVPGPKGSSSKVDCDEGVRADSSLEALARLPPIFRKGGTVTAGNSSTLNDGAAALVLMSPDAAERLGCAPLARWVGCASAGVSPRTMGIGPVPAAQRALRKVGWSIADLDLIELNEAFAAQALSVIKALDLDPDKTNVNGGAIAIGHPLGCSGARIAVGLIHELRRRGQKRGLASLCVGVGQGVATLFETC